MPEGRPTLMLLSQSQTWPTPWVAPPLWPQVVCRISDRPRETGLVSSPMIQLTELQFISVPTPPESRISIHDHAQGTSDTDAPSSVGVDLANTMGSIVAPSGLQDFRSASGDGSRLFPADSADAELQFIAVPTPPESRLATSDHTIWTSDTEAASSVADLANTMGSTGPAEPRLGLHDFRSASGDWLHLFPGIPAGSADAAPPTPTISSTER